MRIVAYFASPDAVARAVRDAADGRWRAIAIGSPAFDEKLIESAGATRSPVAGWALAGGLTGAASGLLLTIGTVRQWPGLVVGGKPLVSMPTFLIIVFELTILGASLFTFASFLWAAARARRSTPGASDRTTTDDRFSLLIEPADAAEPPERLLERMGAIEWRYV